MIRVGTSDSAVKILTRYHSMNSVIQQRSDLSQFCHMLKMNIFMKLLVLPYLPFQKLDTV